MAEHNFFSLAFKNGNPDDTRWPQLTSSADNQLDLEGSLKLQPGVAVTKFSNDGALAGNSALALPTEQAVKTYVDAQIGQVNTALATKALLAGATTQDFTTRNLTVAGTITANQFIGDGSGLTGTTQWVNGAGGAISYGGGNVGINTTAPTRAKLEVAGMIGNTVGLFGADAQGIALVANWAALGINAYFNNGWKSISAGWTANIHVNQDAGGITFQIGQRSTTANAPITLANHFHVGANGAVSIPGQLNFGSQVRQMINLWSTEYGIGVQAGTTYFRSWANFCWFKGGSHSDARDNPGGGARLMALNEFGDLILSARTNPTGASTGSLCRALVDLGNQLSINHGNDFRNGIVLNNGQVSVVGPTVTAAQFRGTLVGAKVGYVVDQFINNLGETLEEGDVVVLGDNQTSLYYGDRNDVPIPEVDLTETPYDTRACGIVCQVYADLQTDGDEASNEAINFKTFTSEEQAELEITKVKPGQIGTMVTLGTYAYCKVDADIAPIKIGDLLTTSPTKGHAQKVLDRPAAIGAIIAKALAPLDQGKGKISVMVTLH